MNADQPPPLPPASSSTDLAGRSRYSAEGLRRKRVMLAELQGAMVRRRCQRSAARAGAVGAVPALAIGVATWMLIHTGGGPTGRNLAREATGSVPSETPPLAPRPVMTRARLECVQTDPERVHRFIVSAPAKPLVPIDDDELLEALAQAGARCGIVRSGSRVLVTDNTNGDELRVKPLGRGEPAAPPAGPGAMRAAGGAGAV